MDVPRIPTYPCGTSRNVSPIARGYLVGFFHPQESLVGTRKSCTSDPVGFRSRFLDETRLEL